MTREARARWGEPSGDRTADFLWRFDPDLPEVCRLTAESNRQSEVLVTIEAEIVATEATTAEGARCKLLIAIWFWKLIELPDAAPEYHEEVSLALMRGAERTLARRGV